MSMQLLSREHEHTEPRPSAALDHATSHAITLAILRQAGSCYS
jgi:hypothetical protein